MKNLSIKKGTVINSEEFSEMSDLLSSIDYEAGITDNQFKAIEYFANLHNVNVFEVVGKHNEQYMSKYIKGRIDNGIKEAEKIRDEIRSEIMNKDSKGLYSKYKERTASQLKENINIITAGDLMTKKVH